MEIEKKICIWSRSGDIGTVPNLLKKLFVRWNGSCLKMTCDRATWVWCLFKFIWYNQNPSLLFQWLAICPLWILRQCLCNSAIFSLTSSNSLLFSSRHCFFLLKNKIMTWNGTFLLAKATSTATLARSPRVTIVPYMKMKQYWARGRILVQRGFVSRGNLFFNQTGNCSPPSHFFALFVIKICKTPWFLSRLEKEKHLYFGHFQQIVNLPFSLLTASISCNWMFSH